MNAQNTQKLKGGNHTTVNSTPKATESSIDTKNSKRDSTIDMFTTNTAVQMQKINDDMIDNLFTVSVDNSMQIWGQTLLKIKNDNEHLLYAMSEGVIKTEIVDDTFILYAKSQKDCDELNEFAVHTKLQNYLSCFSNKKLVVKYVEVVGEEQNDIEYLKLKFGDKLKINSLQKKT